MSVTDAKTEAVSHTRLLDDWREALDLSLSGHAHGKLMLPPAGPAHELEGKLR